MDFKIKIIEAPGFLRGKDCVNGCRSSAIKCVSIGDKHISIPFCGDNECKLKAIDSALGMIEGTKQNKAKKELWKRLASG